MVYDESDGYVLLFGGTYFGGPVDHQNWRCLNDTWIYRAGVWTNLSTPDPPLACSPSLAYDPDLGYVVAYIGSYADTVSINGTWVSVNETWKFEHGRWTELNISGPSPAGGFYASSFDPMVYDPSLKAVVLYETKWIRIDGNLTLTQEQWQFYAGEWHRIGALNPYFGADTTWPGEFVYDASNRSELDFGQKSVVELFGKGWINVSEVPTWIRYAFDWNAGSVTYFPRDNSVLAYTMAPGQIGPRPNATWAYRDGTWTDLWVIGPPYRDYAAIVYDVADGYVLFFGGMYPTIGSFVVLNDTWTFATFSAVQLAITVAPSKICSLQDTNCGVASTIARIHLQVSVIAGPVPNVTWVDYGNETAQFESDTWMAAPSVSFIGWGEIIPSPYLDPNVTCYRQDREPVGCAEQPWRHSPGSGGQLTWNWSLPDRGIVDALRVGSEWNISFNVEARAPPYGPVPVDSCVTPKCLEAGSGSVATYFSRFEMSPWGNATYRNASLPLGTVNVRPPVPSNSAPSTSPPSVPPPPPSIGAPLPASPPATPVINPSPLPTPAGLSAAVSAGVSVNAIAAGVMGAALMRLAVERETQRVRVAMRVSATTRTYQRIRGQN